jgi:subtilisin family serine protease
MQVIPPAIETKSILAEKVGIAVLLCSGLALGGALAIGMVRTPEPVQPSYTPVAPLRVESDATINPTVVLVKAVTGVGKADIESSVKTTLQSFVAKLNTSTTRTIGKSLVTTAIASFSNVYPEKLVVMKTEKRNPSQSVGLDRWYAVKLTQPIDTIAFSRQLAQATSIIERAQPDYTYAIQQVPNDTYYSTSGTWGQPYDDLWALKPERMDTEHAWDITSGDPNVIIAVSDTGVDITHPDIDDNIWVNTDEIPANHVDDDSNGFIDDVNGWNFTDHNNNLADYLGHGTHVAGTIAGEMNNAQGIAGVCPNCTIMPVRGFSNSGAATTLSATSSIVYAAANGADVISMSWTAVVGSADDYLIKDALDEAHDVYGVTLIAGSGNDGADFTNRFLPATHPDVIAVGATDASDARIYWSNYGAALDVVAPGVDILSLRAVGSDMCNRPFITGQVCIVGEEYIHVSGTSMATPHVSGVAGLLLSLNSSFTPEDIKSRIENSAEDVNSASLPGRDNYIGYGRVNAYAALTSCIDGTPFGGCNSSSQQYCDNGTLLFDCQKCSYTCPAQNPYCAADGSCEQRCADGTAVAQCNASKEYCDYDFQLHVNCNFCSMTCSAETPFCSWTGQCVAVCSDGTPSGQCNIESRQYCDSGVLTENCIRCGCSLDRPFCDWRAQNPICQAKCWDGTAFGACNSTGDFCSQDGLLEPDCSRCGCPTSQPFCDTLSKACQAKCADGTDFGSCSATHRYCANGTLQVLRCDRCNQTCPSGYACTSNGQCCKPGAPCVLPDGSAVITQPAG